MARGELFLSGEATSQEMVEHKIKLARAILTKARHDEGKWKVFLESVLLELHMHDYERALKMCQVSIDARLATGRTWAALVSIHHYISVEKEVFSTGAVLAALRVAIRAVPKSGETWCEAARLFLNPFNTQFSVERGRRFLEFAQIFTPQFGDTFLELIRLQYVENLVAMEFEVNFDFDDLDDGDSRIVAALDCAELEGVRRACVESDPNYGILWLAVRYHPFLTSNQVFEAARKRIYSDFVGGAARIYLKALQRREITVQRLLHHANVNANVNANVDFERSVEKSLRGEESISVEFESLSARDFVVGVLPSESEQRKISEMTRAERAKNLYETDVLLV